VPTTSASGLREGEGRDVEITLPSVVRPVAVMLGTAPPMGTNVHAMVAVVDMLTSLTSTAPVDPLRGSGTIVGVVPIDNVVGSGKPSRRGVPVRLMTDMV
jgi:hypothetical protein